MSTSQQVDPLIGRLVDGRYRVRARIARGGMATVYVATDLRLERRVALKVMHGHLSDDSVFQSRFIQEARSAARLADPHVVNVFDQGQDGELAYLVMEYLPGITLRELLKEQRRLTVTQTITIMDAVLSGLAAAHRAGLIHRDVKPENVLLAEDGRIKIGDFGLARASSANTATGQQLLGTIAYLAPELVTRGTADARSDIYALGILLYEMLAGEQPYKGEQPMQIAFQHATESVPRPSVKNPGVPEQLDELVLWATEKEPDERPADAQQMLERLREIERELGIAPVPTRAAPAFETRVMPSEAPAAGATKVLPGGALSTTGEVTGDIADTGPAAEPDNASKLRTRAHRRRRRGGILIALVLLLAAAAGGAGWWFGSGPGSMVQVPEVAGMTFDEAAAALQEQELIAVQQPESSLDVAPGTAIRSEPGPGTSLDRGEDVTVVISAGPAEVSLEPFAGMSLAEAKALLDQHHITYDDADNLALYADADKDQVIGLDILPAGTEDRVPCFEGCAAHQGDTADFIVSLGRLPDVTGQHVDAAVTALGDAGLDVTVTEEYSSGVQAQHIIRVEPRFEEGNWRPGDPITIVKSLGPRPVEIPAVADLHRDEAISTLRNAGFEVSYDARYDNIRNDCVTAQGTSPGAGEARLPGTTVTVTFSVPFFDFTCFG